MDEPRKEWRTLDEAEARIAELEALVAAVEDAAKREKTDVWEPMPEYEYIPPPSRSAIYLIRQERRIAELEEAVGEALDVLKFIEFFVKSRQRIKKPEGHEIFDTLVADLRRVKEKRDG